MSSIIFIQSCVLITKFETEEWRRQESPVKRMSWRLGIGEEGRVWWGLYSWMEKVLSLEREEGGWCELKAPLRWVYVGGQIALAYVRLEWWMITGRTIRGRVGGWVDWGMDGWKKRVSNAWINGFMDRHMDRLMSGYVDLLMDWFLSISMYCRRWLKSVAEANKTHCSLWSNFTSTASEVWSKQLCLH